MTNTQQIEPTADLNKRKKLFAGLATAIAVIAASYGTYWYFIGSRYISTDNAYAAVEVALVTPAVGGIVSEVTVVDTQQVNKGDVLVQLDNTDAKLALEQANAQLALARRRVESYLATDSALSAQVEAREADKVRASAQLKAAKADLERAQLELKRRQNLRDSGSVSAEELTNAKNGLVRAQANLNAALAAVNQTEANRLATIGSKDANAAMIANTTVETNPEVLAAKARYDQALVDFERTVVRAPVDGVIAQRQVQVGQKVQPGVPLLSVVPIHKMHVNANFKEVELRDVRLGQPVELTADLYGDKVVFHGVVTGIAGGTGSAFSLIPAQNATGNWIKVVQRLPVRITLDESELQQHPLQVGLSMIATVDTSASEDKQLAELTLTTANQQG